MYTLYTLYTLYTVKYCIHLQPDSLYWNCAFILRNQILFVGRCCYGTRERRSWLSTKAGTVATICQSLNISMTYHEVSSTDGRKTSTSSDIATCTTCPTYQHGCCLRLDRPPEVGWELRHLPRHATAESMDAL